MHKGYQCNVFKTIN